MLRGDGWAAFNELKHRRTATVFSERSGLPEPLLPAGKGFGIPVISYFWYSGTVSTVKGTIYSVVVSAGEQLA